LEGEVAAAGDREERWLGWMSVYFIHLAGRTSLHVSSDEIFHVGPPIMGLDQLDSFYDSRVSGSFRSVKMVKYPPPKIIAFHDNEGITLS
jgi:hypothetical protein